MAIRSDSVLIAKACDPPSSRAMPLDGRTRVLALSARIMDP